MQDHCIAGRLWANLYIVVYPVYHRNTFKDFDMIFFGHMTNPESKLENVILKYNRIQFQTFWTLIKWSSKYSRIYPES